MADGSEELLIIDTDGGTDDCHGILIAAAAAHVEVLAITCVVGNVDVDQVAQNVLITVNTSDKLRKAKCPIYLGAARPLAGFPIHRFNVHGEDGLGNTKRLDDPQHEFLKDEAACLALVKLVNQYPGQISIAAIGPLTNLALATRIDPNFSSKIKKLIIMGGDSEGRGNITPCAEFNFCADPEAAKVVLHEFTCRKILVSWELTMKYAWNIDWMHKQLFLEDCRVGRFLRETHEHILEVCKNDPAMCTGGLVGLFPACDQLAVALTIRPELITKFDHFRCSVETSGVSSRGHLVIDRGSVDQSLKGVTPTDIITEVDFEKFKEVSLLSLEA
ncbi:probable uridine nucleosidase 2 isoform X2 [Lytechinus variegatus]|nr:probable uridine nucleosidase 2 isoform X2 [Lytechinus variegatus]XP_041456305.1 probable uridine nucleosidase 2 isoform X2 [Lytechinus variegatus]XP_041456306.1 probable uridine nucleosidase 2 isoform X2 [Lytechinus variegatus]